ncbi:Nicastrin [Morella rubra]|uniref:Nicastrin n=1 Tax=Morella rubra TaxID=262757 RepID=A0A6A1W8A7_9ROSI|nr:Nicastrin [Morella rubra]
MKTRTKFDVVNLSFSEWFVWAVYKWLMYYGTPIFVLKVIWGKAAIVPAIISSCQILSSNLFSCDPSLSGQLDSMESVPDLQKAMIIKFIDGYPFVRLLNLSGTTKAGTHDLESCLKEETCLPLGGYRDSTAQVSVASPNEDELIAMANALSGANVFPPIERENNSTVTVPKAEISNMAFAGKGYQNSCCTPWGTWSVLML